MTSLTVKRNASSSLFESLTFLSNQQPELVKNVFVFEYGPNESFRSIAVSILSLSEALSMWP